MKIIVISAHPDDEVLGCGGTLAKHKAAGDEISWLITTNVFEHQGFSKERVETRKEEVKEISIKLGISKVKVICMKRCGVFCFHVPHGLHYLYLKLLSAFNEQNPNDEEVKTRGKSARMLARDLGKKASKIFTKYLERSARFEVIRR